MKAIKNAAKALLMVVTLVAIGRTSEAQASFASINRAKDLAVSAVTSVGGAVVRTGVATGRSVIRKVVDLHTLTSSAIQSFNEIIQWLDANPHVYTPRLQAMINWFTALVNG